jgi:large subunit ribosomal protein L4
MPVVDVKDIQGDKVGQLELSDEVFGAPIKEHLFWEVVRGQLAKRRAGTAKTKGRSEMRGGGRKPYRQKGTGRARAGSRRAPGRVGGAAAFGPKPRSYAIPVPKKVRAAALRSALSLRLSEQQLVVLENLELPEVKTRALDEILGRFEIDSALIVESKANANLVLSARNLARHKFIPPEGLNVYDILRYKTLVTTQDVARALDDRLKAHADRAGAGRTP